MGLLTNLMCVNWSNTTLLQVLVEAEQHQVETFDVAHLELKDGRDYLVAVITGEKAVQAAELLEQLRTGGR
ncbi:hypothetical protein D9M68_799710 [compost metagenome]